MHMERHVETFTSAGLARAAAINPETIRFYERNGLIKPESRSAAGYRIFTLQAADRIRFIKRAQQLGFSLREIKELLSMRQERTGRECAAVKNLAREKIDEIDDKLRTLKKMRAILTQLEQQCPGSGPLSGCPIIGCLQEQTTTVSKARKNGGRRNA